jgi:hypothetical protein
MRSTTPCGWTKRCSVTICSDAELRFTVSAVAAIADEWDDRLKQMFGGATYQEVLQKSTDHQARQRGVSLEVIS